MSMRDTSHTKSHLSGSSSYLRAKDDMEIKWKAEYIFFKEICEKWKKLRTKTNSEVPSSQVALLF